MISFISGKIKVKTEKSIIIDVSGVGYEVFTIPILLEKLKEGQEASLYTLLYVREEIMELYGFASREELEFFKEMISVSGVGPKSALGILTLSSIADLKKAIVNEDASLLTKVSGIGKKTAERLILELKNRISLQDMGEGKKTAGASEESQAIDALVNLGYSIREAREALQHVDRDIDNMRDRIKAALQLLGKK